jgi:polysaccharide biosynthesis/export protein
MKNRVLLLLLVCLSLALGAQTNPLPGNQIYITVGITGFVPQPGTYQVTLLNRVSDVLKLAQGLGQLETYTDIPTPQQVMKAEKDSLYSNFQALRTVKLIRGKDTTVCDLQKFLRLGDLAQNPLLRDGDVINVASVQASVALQGEVYLEGEYEFVPGDKLSDLLSLAQGPTLSADQRNISIYRYKENLTDFDILKIDLTAQDATNISLQANDRVFVPLNSAQRREWKVKVEGNVLAPGEYLIGQNTTLYDVLSQCGGPDANGDLRYTIFANGSYMLNPDPEFERLKELSLSQMSPLEYSFMRAKLRQFPGRYGVDVDKVWNARGGEPNPVVKNGDYLYVPEKVDMVEVSGQVMHPGLVSWVEGKNFEYYIAQAGGYTNNKRWDGVRIISRNSGNWVKPSKKGGVDPGDNIFVAEKNDRDFWTDFKDVVLIVSQLVTIYLGVRTISTP